MGSFVNARRVTVEIDGRTIPFIGREALVRNKRSTGREKDRLDADLLETASARSPPGA